MSSPAAAFLLFCAALVAGALNAVAGGGSFITLPALIHAGIAPVVANATSTLALWPGSLSSTIAYRRDIRTDRGSLVGLGVASLIGGLVGAWLLVSTSDRGFMRLLPWLMLIAALTFTFGDRVSRRFGVRVEDAGDPGVRFPIWVFGLQLLIAVYGGYFGGGMGYMMLAAMAVAGLRDIHEMNGLKMLLGTTLNGVALVEFVGQGKIAWAPGLVMVAGSIVGGYAGASLARRVDRRRVRTFVVIVGWVMTAYFFLR